MTIPRHAHDVTHALTQEGTQTLVFTRSKADGLPTQNGEETEEAHGHT